ncbi:MAG: alkaline phosphatase family protein [Ilumatobacteraceae bacterium]
MSAPDTSAVRPAVGGGPLLPDYDGANVRGIVPALLAGPHPETPSWFPSPVSGAENVVLLVLDGLGWEQLRERAVMAPTLSAMVGGPIMTVAPSTTATALTSIATGLTPAEHGIIGYRTLLGGEVTNMLRWASGDRDRRHDAPPSSVQPAPAFCGQRVPVVTAHELTATPFSEAHLRPGALIGYRAASSLPVLVSRSIAAGARFVHAYYAGVDRIAHERGFGDFYDAELAAADALVADLLDRLDPGTVLLVTADHGQVDVGDRLIEPSPGLLELVSLQSGEGRMRWFHSIPGAAGELLAAAEAEFSDTGWVRSREQVIDERWFGRAISGPVAGRLGDVVVAAREPVSYVDPDDSGPFELVCRHGSLTSAEMLVPLVAARGVGRRAV